MPETKIKPKRTAQQRWKEKNIGRVITLPKSLDHAVNVAVALEQSKRSEKIRELLEKWMREKHPDLLKEK